MAKPCGHTEPDEPQCPGCVRGLEDRVLKLERILRDAGQDIHGEWCTGDWVKCKKAMCRAILEALSK